MILKSNNFNGVNLFSITQTLTTFLRDVIANIGEKSQIQNIIFFLTFFTICQTLLISTTLLVCLLFIQNLNTVKNTTVVLKSIDFHSVKIINNSIQNKNFKKIIIQVGGFCSNIEFDSINIKCTGCLLIKNTFSALAQRAQFFTNFDETQDI